MVKIIDPAKTSFTERIRKKEQNKSSEFGKQANRNWFKNNI